MNLSCWTTTRSPQATTFRSPPTRPADGTAPLPWPIPSASAAATDGTMWKSNCSTGCLPPIWWRPATAFAAEPTWRTIWPSGTGPWPLASRPAASASPTPTARGAATASSAMRTTLPPGWDPSAAPVRWRWMPPPGRVWWTDCWPATWFSATPCCSRARCSCRWTLGMGPEPWSSAPRRPARPNCGARGCPPAARCASSWMAGRRPRWWWTPRGRR